MTTAIIPIKLKIDVLSQYQEGDAVPVEHGGTGVTSIEELKQLLGVGSGGGSEEILRFDPEYLNCAYENGEISYPEVLPLNFYDIGFIFSQPLDLSQKIIIPMTEAYITFGVLNTTLAEQLEYNNFDSLPLFNIIADLPSQNIIINNNTVNVRYNFGEATPTHFSFQLDGKGVVVSILQGTDLLKEIKLKVQSNCRTTVFKFSSQNPMQLPISIF